MKLINFVVRIQVITMFSWCDIHDLSCDVRSLIITKLAVKVVVKSLIKTIGSHLHGYNTSLM